MLAFYSLYEIYEFLGLGAAVATAWATAWPFYSLYEIYEFLLWLLHYTDFRKISSFLFSLWDLWILVPGFLIANAVLKAILSILFMRFMNSCQCKVPRVRSRVQNTAFYSLYEIYEFLKLFISCCIHEIVFIIFLFSLWDLWILVYPHSP